MRFRTQYEEREHRANSKKKDWNRYVSRSGDGYENEYERYIDEKGVEELRITGKTDQQAFIQSHKDSVDFDAIIARYMLGDEDALNKVQGFYADVSQIPTSLHDMLNKNLEGQQLFEKLPVEIKQLFHNSYYEFLLNPQYIEEYYKSLAENNADSEPKPEPEPHEVNDNE